MSTARRLAVAAVGALAVLVALAAPASAHPLGNFTVNRYARAEVSAGVVRVHYVLDLAELPAFQVRDELAADREGFVDDQVASIGAGLRLEVDGRPAALVPVDRLLTEPAGDAGLPTVRLAVTFEAAVPGDADQVHEARLVDAAGDRVGWREVVVAAEGDAEVLSSSVPDQDVSDELTDYPEDQLRSPLDVREARFRYTGGSDAVAATPLLGGPDERGGGDRFTRLLDRGDLSPVVLAGMLAAAALVGVGHALAPGHGKTVMAAYLIGTRGRPVDALSLGVIVSAMHTASVLALGAVLHQVDDRFALDRIYPWLTLVSGAGVLVVGAWLAVTRWRAARRRAAGDLVHDHHHDHADHDHHHHDDADHGHHGGHDHRAEGGDHSDLDHGHRHEGSAGVVHGAGAVQVLERTEVSADDDHGHHHGPGGHSHDLPEGVAPLSRRGLVLLAMAGGIVPSPSAVVVLVSAFALGRAGLGLALVAAFSVGLAATLTAVGLALVLGSRAIGGRLSTRVLRSFPVVGALALTVVGLVLVTQGVRGL